LIPGYILLARRIKDEIPALDRSVKRANDAWQASIKDDTNQKFLIDSVALNLHSFYAGIERLLERIAEQLEKSLPQSPSWHKELLKQMSMDLPKIRPPVLSPNSVTSLDEFRRFRHVVRNAYSEYLDAKRIGQLVNQLTKDWKYIQQDLESFAEFLEGVSQADDSI